MLTACLLHDLRTEPRGGFAGAVDPDALHGTYAGDRRSRRNGAGSFASVAHPRRWGSFADADRDLLVSCEADGRRSRVAGDLAIRRVLGRAGLDDEAAGRVIDELHLGRAILLVEIAEVTPSEAQAQLEHVGEAA